MVRGQGLLQVSGHMLCILVFSCSNAACLSCSCCLASASFLLHCRQALLSLVATFCDSICLSVLAVSLPEQMAYDCGMRKAGVYIQVLTCARWMARRSSSAFLRSIRRSATISSGEAVISCRLRT